MAAEICWGTFSLHGVSEHFKLAGVFCKYVLPVCVSFGFSL